MKSPLKTSSFWLTIVGSLLEMIGYAFKESGKHSIKNQPPTNENGQVDTIDSPSPQNPL